MGSIFDKFFRPDSRFLRDYESYCVDCLAAMLPIEAQTILEKQVAAIERIERSPDGRSVSLQLARTTDLLRHFPNKAPELKAARIVFRTPAEGYCDLVVKNGELRGLEFQFVPKKGSAGELVAERVDLHGELLAVG